MNNIDKKLIMCIQQGDMNGVQSALTQGADVNALDSTPLLCSLIAGLPYALKLLEHGAQVVGTPAENHEDFYTSIAQHAGVYVYEGDTLAASSAIYELLAISEHYPNLIDPFLEPIVTNVDGFAQKLIDCESDKQWMSQMAAQNLIAAVYRSPYEATRDIGDFLRMKAAATAALPQDELSIP